MKTTLIVSAGALAAALAAAGCASPPRHAGYDDPYAAALYTGAPRPDAADHYALLYAPEQTSANGAPFELVSYAGIDGARRAHERYADNEAEALDGRCEASVAPSASESLIDIAELCDVPLDMLVEFNPGVADISYSTAGAMVKIPGGIEAPQGAFAMTDALVQLDAVQAGDTLEKIAYRLNVSQATIANLNPDVDWTNPVAGQAFIKPASVPPSSPSASYAPSAPGWEGYDGARGIGGSEAGSAVGATAHAPYLLKPVKSYARPAGVYPEAAVDVDRRYVKVGDTVNVTAQVAPNADVLFYSGDAPGAMQERKTVRADEKGRATAPIRVKKGSNMGGVVFGAREIGSSETKYSDRVNVIKLDKEPASSGSGGETATEASE